MDIFAIECLRIFDRMKVSELKTRHHQAAYTPTEVTIQVGRYPVFGGIVQCGMSMSS